jgi:hypothetical protein
MGNNHRVMINALTRREMEDVILAANFTHDQEVIFKELNQDVLYDIAIMQKLGIPPRRYYDTKRLTVDKTERVLKYLGYNHAIKTAKNRPSS